VLLEEEPDAFEALERAAVRLHSLYLLTAKANGAKNVGKPLHVPRPHDEVNQSISPRDFAAMMRR